jgi:hypothetical protein
LERNLTDQEKWADAVMVVRREYGELSEEARAALAGMAAALRLEKREFHSLTAGMGSERLCADCMGACCRSGKYHFSVVDLLVFLSGGEEIVKPSFQVGCCPYMGKDGCQMEPSFRPFPCITFHCEELLSLLAPEAAERLPVLEKGLRTRYGQIEKYFDKPLMKSMLIAYEDYLRDPARGLISTAT